MLSASYRDMCGVVDWGVVGGGGEEVQQEVGRFQVGVALLGEIILNGYLLFTSRVCQNSRGLFVPWYFVHQVLYR